MEETTLSGRIPFDDAVPIKNEKPGKLKRKKNNLEILTYFFILLFTYASLRKLADIKMFVKELWGFSLFGSKPAVKWELITLCILELTVAILLSIKRTRLLGLYGTFILLFGINLASLYMQQFAILIPPIFGGILPYISFAGHLLFNITVLFISLIGLLSGIKLKQCEYLT